MGLTVSVSISNAVKYVDLNDLTDIKKGTYDENTEIYLDQKQLTGIIENMHTLELDALIQKRIDEIFAMKINEFSDTRLFTKLISEMQPRALLQLNKELKRHEMQIELIDR